MYTFMMYVYHITLTHHLMGRYTGSVSMTKAIHSHMLNKGHTHMIQIRTMQPRQNYKISHSIDNRTTPSYTTRLVEQSLHMIRSLLAQVQPDRLSSLALLQCTLQFIYYYYCYYYFYYFYYY